MTELTYHLKVTNEADQTWSGIFVDAEGCMTQGSSESEVLSRAVEALDCHLRAYLSLGKAPPRPFKEPPNGTYPIKVSAKLTPKLVERLEAEFDSIYRPAKFPAKVQEVLCNWCGHSCTIDLSVGPDPIQESCGLINATVIGGFGSTPGNGDGALDDMQAYQFSLCEFCLDYLFQCFKTPPLCYDAWGGTIHPEPWLSAADRIRKDEWRTQVAEFHAASAARALTRRVI